MQIVTRPIDVWPGELRTWGQRQRAPFTARYGQTRALLDKELRALGAHHVVMQLAIHESDLRLDGEIRANARPAAHPGVMLAFESKHGPLKYATDIYNDWQHNVRAIALGLEALRKVDRYGITKRGEQYTGWSALPPATAMGAALTREEAARILIAEGEVETADEPCEVDMLLLCDQETITGYYRRAAKRHHPDVGGDPQAWDAIERAYRALTEG